MGKYMNIIILGAGELGKYLATIFSLDKHDITVIDQDDELLTRLRDRLDVMTITGNGAEIGTLKKAGIGDCELMVAVSGDQATNVLACQVASHLGVTRTICKLNSSCFFSEDDNFTASTLNIDKVVLPVEECVDKILGVLDNHIVTEKILFSDPNALMTSFEVLPSAPLAGTRIRDFPVPDLLNSVRFAAILRDHQHLIPHGDTIFVPGDQVYVAGPKEKVESMVAWNSPKDASITRVVIVGASRIGSKLAAELAGDSYEVRLIEQDEKDGKRLLDEIGAEVMVINGDPTENEVLMEAGVDVCDAFVSALDDDEENILSCILAKRIGAKKVVTVTNKSEYIDIIPAMEMIDCGFTSSLVAVNTVLRSIGTGSGTISIDAILHRINAYLYEFKVQEGAPACGMKVDEIKFPLAAVLALVFRNGQVLAVTGNLELHKGDVVVTIANRKTFNQIEPLFRKKGFFPV